MKQYIHEHTEKPLVEWESSVKETRFEKVKQTYQRVSEDFSSPLPTKEVMKSILEQFSTQTFIDVSSMFDHSFKRISGSGVFLGREWYFFGINPRRNFFARQEELVKRKSKKFFKTKIEMMAFFYLSDYKIDNELAEIKDYHVHERGSVVSLSFFLDCKNGYWYGPTKTKQNPWWSHLEKLVLNPFCRMYDSTISERWREI